MKDDNYAQLERYIEKLEAELVELKTQKPIKYVTVYNDCGKFTGQTTESLYSHPVPAKVPEGWKLLKDTTEKDREWSEDAKHENGLYFNTCIHCGRNFIGHKR